jgi:hypothetical protein
MSKLVDLGLVRLATKENECSGAFDNVNCTGTSTLSKVVEIVVQY